MNSTGVLLEIAKNLLVEYIDDTQLKGLEVRKLVERIQAEFDSELRKFYLETEYSKEVNNLKNKKSTTPLDEQALHLLAKYSEGQKRTPQIARQLPKFNKRYKNPGFECTLSTALIRLALEQLGYKNTKSVLLRRHYVAIRELSDGSIKFYDAANRATRNGQTEGFTHTFKSSEIADKKFIGENQYIFTIKTKSKLDGTEVFSKKDNNGYYTRKFFAYDPLMLIHLTVILENLSEFIKHEDKFSIGFCKRYPYLMKLNFKELKKNLNLFDGYGYI